jgi:septal ring factor EnvC (AmiA/AmiB activator)
MLMFAKTPIKLLVIIGACLVDYSYAGDFSQSSQKTTEELSSVQKSIKQQQKEIALTSKKRAALEAQLKQDELAIARAAKAVNNTNQQLENTQKKIIALQVEQADLMIKKMQQQKLLAQQLRAAYSTGNHDYLKLLLNQEKPASIQRTLTYYNYFNQARINEIENFQATVKKLAEVEQQQQAQKVQLNQLKAQQIQQQKTLEESSKARKSTVKKLSRQLLTKQQQLEKLKAAEENLVIELERIQQLAKVEQNLRGLSHLKHKLNWPIKGEILQRFGSKKQGYLKWKGVLISAPIGRTVQAIHNGKVLFADWLNGYGLVTVIDHGDGYMSLYGHNQALLKDVGDSVETGEPIALVGQSGGQQASGLYFEIRHRGKAVNPKTWCK